MRTPLATADWTDLVHPVIELRHCKNFLGKVLVDDKLVHLLVITGLVFVDGVGTKGRFYRDGNTRPSQRHEVEARK